MPMKSWSVTRDSYFMASDTLFLIGQIVTIIPVQCIEPGCFIAQCDAHLSSGVNHQGINLWKQRYILCRQKNTFARSFVSHWPGWFAVSFCPASFWKVHYQYTKTHCFSWSNLAQLNGMYNMWSMKKILFPYTGWLIEILMVYYNP